MPSRQNLTTLTADELFEPCKAALVGRSRTWWNGNTLDAAAHTLAANVLKYPRSPLTAVRATIKTRGDIQRRIANALREELQLSHAGAL